MIFHQEQWDILTYLMKHSQSLFDISTLKDPQFTSVEMEVSERLNNLPKVIELVRRHNRNLNLYLCVSPINVLTAIYYFRDIFTVTPVSSMCILNWNRSKLELVWMLVTLWQHGLIHIIAIVFMPLLVKRRYYKLHTQKLEKYKDE